MWQFLRRVSLTQWIMISMAAGILVGYFYPLESQSVKVISTVFLKMIKCILMRLFLGLWWWE